MSEGTALAERESSGEVAVSPPVRQERSRSRGPLWIILALYGVTATAWAWLNPVFEAPDEPFHVAYVNLLVREHRWPQESDIAPTIGFMEAHASPERSFQIFNAGQSEIFIQWAQPPLYYLLQMIPLALAYPGGYDGVLVPARPDYGSASERGYFQHDRAEPWSWTRELVGIRLMRLVSVLLGGLTVWWTARLARLVAPNSAALPVLAAALYAFIPQFTFMASTVNNDVSGYLAATIALWMMVRVAQGAWSPRKAIVLLGLCLGLGMLAKQTTTFLWPLTFVVAGLAYRRWADRTVCALGVMAVAFIVAWSFFGGRPDASLDVWGYYLTGRPSAWLTFSSGFLGNAPVPSFAYLGKVLGMLSESFWGQFGWFQVRIDQTALAMYWLLVGVALVGWCWRGPNRQVSSGGRKALTVLGLAITSLLAFLALWYVRMYVPQGGRHLLVVGSAIAVFLAMGLLRAHRPLVEELECPVSERGWTWGLVAVFVCLNWVVLWRSIYHAYAVAWGAS